MYLELINDFKKSNSFINPNCPSSKEEISNAEKVMKISFPSELSDLLFELNGDCCLLLSVRQIIEDNTLVRTELCQHYDGLEFLLFFATNGCGDYYSYRITDGRIDKTSIVMWEHETNEVKVVAHSIKELIKKYYGDEI